MVYVGLDLAFASSGLVVLDENNRVIDHLMIVTYNDMHDYDRAAYIVVELKTVLQSIAGMCMTGSVANQLGWCKKHLKVNIERLSFASKNPKKDIMAYVHHKVREWLYRHDIACDVTSAGTLKKYATGKGRCTKQDVKDAVLERWKIKWSNDDLADAYVLARMVSDQSRNNPRLPGIP